jgi:hypothetical protein
MIFDYLFMIIIYFLFFIHSMAVTRKCLRPHEYRAKSPRFRWYTAEKSAGDATDPKLYHLPNTFKSFRKLQQW